MSVFDRWFRRAEKRPGTTLDLAVVLEALAQSLPGIEQPPVDRELLRARLADGLRDAGLVPMDPMHFEVWTDPLDEADWQRLALIVAALDSEALRSAIASAPQARDVDALLRIGFVKFAIAKGLLELELLRQSPQRLEEFARAWLAALELPIAGESPAQSAERLERLDYARLLAESDRAQQAAEKRKAEIERLQEELARKLSPRGKW